MGVLKEKEISKIEKNKVLKATVLAGVLGLGSLFVPNTCSADVYWGNVKSGDYRWSCIGDYISGILWCCGGNDFIVYGTVHSNIGVMRYNRWGHTGRLYIAPNGCTGDIYLFGDSGQNNSALYFNAPGNGILTCGIIGANASYAYFNYPITNSQNKSISVQNLYLQSSFTTDANYIARRSGNISNSGTLTLTGGTFTSNLTSGGTLIIDTGKSVNMQYRVDNRIQLRDNAIITINASNINNGSGIFSSGAGSRVNLNGGTLRNPILGSANINITNNATVAAPLSKFGTTTGAWTVGTNATFALTDGVLEKAITNNGTVKLQGATLGGEFVTSGTLEVAADATFSANYLKANTNKVDKGAVLTLTTGEVGKNLQGDGQLVIDGGGEVKVNSSTITLAHAELDEEQEKDYYDIIVRPDNSLTIMFGSSLKTVTDKLSKVKIEGSMEALGSVESDIYNENYLQVRSTTGNITGKVYNKVDGVVKVHHSGKVTGEAIINEGTFNLGGLDDSGDAKVTAEVFNTGTYNIGIGATQEGNIINGSDNAAGEVNISAGTITCDITNNKGVVTISNNVTGNIINKDRLILDSDTSAATTINATILNYGEMTVGYAGVFEEVTNHGIINFESWNGGIKLVNNQGGVVNIEAEYGCNLFSGIDIDNAGGILNIEKGFLENKIIGGTINFSKAATYAGCIQSDKNNILSGETLHLQNNTNPAFDYGNTLTKAISGEGTLRILTDVTAEQKINSNLAVASGHKLTIQTENLSNGNDDATVDVGGELVLNGDGTLDKNIIGSGKVTIDTDHIDLGGTLDNAALSLELKQGTLVNNGNLKKVKDLTIKDDGILDLQNKDITDVVNIAGNLQAGDTDHGTINLDVALRESWTAPGQLISDGYDKLIVGGNATGTIKLGAINVFSVPTDDTIIPIDSVGYMQVVKATGTNNITFSDAVTVTSAGTKYDFTDGSADQGEKGWLKVTKKLGNTLWEVVTGQDYTATGGDNLALVQTFSLFENFAAGDMIAGAYGSMTGGLVEANFKGTLGNLADATGTSREFTIAGNGYDFKGTESTHNVTGITLSTGQILNLTNIGEISGWQDYVVTNNGGTVNIDSVGEIDANIVNSGIVRFSNGNIDLNGNVTGTDGKMYIAGANVILGSGYSITQDELNINGGSLTASADVIDSINTIKNDGTLIFNDGTLNKVINGLGTIQIGDGTADQQVVVNANIQQNIKVADKGTMKIDADNLLGTVTDNQGTVEFVADGTLTKGIYGSTGKVVIDNGVTLKTSGTAGIADMTEQTVINNGTLDLNGMDIAVGNLIMGSGSIIDLTEDAHLPGQTLKVNGNLSGTGSISVDVKFSGNTDDGSISYLVDSICVGGTVQPGTVLTLTGMNVQGKLDGWGLGKSVSVEIVRTKDGNTANLQELVFDRTEFRDGIYRYIGVQNDANKGQITLTKYFGLTLSQIVQNKDDVEVGGTGKKAADALYDSTADESGTIVPDKQIFAIGSEDYKVDADLGELVSLTQEALPASAAPRTEDRYLIIVGNNHNFDGDGHTGITVRTADTLKLRGMKEVKGFNGNVVTNHGTLEFKASTREAGSVISSGIYNDGNMKFEGKTLLNAAITDNATPNGTMTITEGSEFTVGNNGSITQKSLILETNGVLNTYADKLNITEGITNSGTVNLADGELASKITGGSINIIGNVSSPLNNLVSGEDITVAENAELTLTGGILEKIINNAGTVRLAGATLNGACITSGNLKFAGNTTITDTNFICTDVNIVERGANLTIAADGVLGKVISGEGNIIINGEIKSSVDNFTNTGELIVKSSKTLELTAGVLERGINNSGTVILNGAVLAGRCVDSGVLKFAANSSVTDIAFLGNAENRVESGVKLNIAQGNDTGYLTGQKIINDGTVALGGSFAMQKEVFSAGAGLHIQGGTLDAEGSTLKLIGLHKEDEGKTYTLVDGGATLQNAWLTQGTYTDDSNNGIIGTRLGKYTVANNAGVLTLTIDELKSNFVSLESEEDGVRTPLWHVGTNMFDQGGDKIQKFVDYVADIADSHGEQVAADTFNAVANINSEAAVEHGTIGMMGMMNEALGDNLGIFGRPISGISSRGSGFRNVAADRNDAAELKINTVEKGSAGAVMPSQYKEKVYEKQVWAAFMHNKEHIDGLQLDGIKQNGTAQYNGTMVGCDLWSGRKSFGGIALTYADGHVNSSAGLTSTKNEVDYYGVSVYNRVDNGHSALITDIGYLRSENDITQKAGTNEITADAKINALTAGIRAEKIISVGRSNLVPFAGVRYMYVQNRDYTTKINGGEGMSYSPDNQNLIMPEVGLAWNGEFAVPGSDWLFRPHAETGYVWNLGDRHTENTVMFGGASDTIGYDVMDKGSYFVRVGMELLKGNVTFGAFYKYQKGDAISNSKWNFSVNFAF